MDTKLKSDIGEYRVIAELLKRGFKVLKPVGDRLPYDVAIDLEDKLIRIQIKTAWRRKNVFIVDSRRTKTNRKEMKRDPYCSDDFDIAILYIMETDDYYIMPVSVFCSYKSEITLNGSKGSKSGAYLNRWDVL